jgi:hypothetical protein
MLLTTKRLLFSTVTGLYILTAGLQLYAFVEMRSAHQARLPENYGNFEQVRAALPASPPGNPFTFVIAGDTRSRGTFEKLTKSINKVHPVFIAILGDWVNGGSVNQHAYFRQECAEYDFSCPVFFSPGNHDVDPQKYPLALFEHDYGPRNFSFVYNDCLFIFISHLDSRFSNQESLNFLRSLADQDLNAFRNRFVFMHIPPWISPDIKERHTKDEQELVRLLHKLNADYVLAADFHGYNRTDRNGIEYIISGGGGAHLHESVGRQFHHAIALTVSPDMVSERILPVSKNIDLEDWLELNAVVYIGPAISSHPMLFFEANAAILAGLLWGMTRIRR